MKHHRSRTQGLIATVAILGLSAMPGAHARATGFVTRFGNRLTLNGSPFRFSGTNIYWLGLDENVGGVAYPTNFRVNDVLATAAEMGANVVRAHTLGVSVGNSLSLEPSLGTFNSTAFQSMDYAIWSAGNNGIRLVIPLTDQYNYYTGGEITFCHWRGSSNQNDFYTNTTIVGDFEQYVSTILNHVNQYTGVAYKNDPTIIAWETGNEINPPSSWTGTISTYIKGIDTNHLVVDGAYGINTGSLSLSNVDIYSDHFYPLDSTRLGNDANTVGTANKVFLAGEYAWNNGDLNGFLNTASANANVAGDFSWSLFGHLDTYGFVQHSDGYTIHYPGDTAAMKTAVQSMRSHAYSMRGIAAPAVGVPGAPTNLNIDASGNITWAGAAKAATYQIERATAGTTGPWTTLTTGSVTDNNTPWLDSGHPSGNTWYRIKAANLSGVFGAYSGVYAKTYSGGGSWDPAAWYRFINHSNGKAVDCNGSSTSGSTLVQKTANAGYWDQEWKIVSDGGGYYHLICHTSNLAMDCNGSTTSGTNVLQKSSNSTYWDQQWQIVDLGGGYYRFVCHTGGKAIDSNGSTTEGSALVQKDVSSTATTQQWQIVKD